MKNLFAIFLLSILGMGFLACSKKSGEVLSQSPDSAIHVTVSGSKASFFDPFITNIKVESANSRYAEENMSIETFVEELNETNVTFDWKTNNECIITFKQQDNTIRKLKLNVSANRFHLRDI